MAAGIFNVVSSVAIVVIVVIAANVEVAEAKRKARSFSIFSVVIFPNTQCTLASSDSTQTMVGTCYSSSECLANGGVANGNCASGFGVCCMFSLTACGSVVTKNSTYIQNPGFPNSMQTTGACSYSFAGTSNICQIRLDFDRLVLAPPSTNDAVDIGRCNVDTVVFNPGTTTSTNFPFVPPILCGTLTGSHMYFETDKATAAGTMTFNIMTVTDPARTWKIKVTQIECFSLSSPPLGCTQYYTSTSGIFQSFNFAGGTENFIEKMLYSACFRQAEGYCSLGFFPDPSAGLSGFNFNVKVIAGVAKNVAKHTCVSVGILIPTRTTGPTAIDQQETSCGAYLNVVSGNTANGDLDATVLPWNLVVFSKSAPLSPETVLGQTYSTISKGFKLLYRQKPCV